MAEGSTTLRVKVHYCRGVEIPNTPDDTPIFWALGYANEHTVTSTAKPIVDASWDEELDLVVSPARRNETINVVLYLNPSNTAPRPLGQINVSAKDIELGYTRHDWYDGRIAPGQDERPDWEVLLSLTVIETPLTQTSPTIQEESNSKNLEEAAVNIQRLVRGHIARQDSKKYKRLIDDMQAEEDERQRLESERTSRMLEEMDRDKAMREKRDGEHLERHKQARRSFFAERIQ